MLLTYESCQHSRVEPMQNADYDGGDDEFVVFTCLVCYKRLAVTATEYLQAARQRRDIRWQPARPPGPCKHSLKPVQEKLTSNRPYHDAICNLCGRVLRHPDGPGEWTDVLFYGFVIKEQPYVNIAMTSYTS